MIKADKYFKENIEDIIYRGDWDKNPRPKWKDGSKANSKFVTQRFFKYNIQNKEFPIITYRKTPLKASFYDIKAIYIDQTNDINKMHKSIKNWWKDFVVEKSSIGRTYGYIVRKYDLMNNLLYTMENSPFNRRHIIDLWQYSEYNKSPKALKPCAFQTLWTIKEGREMEHAIDSSGVYYYPVKYRLVDLSLVQRSMDYLVTASINPMQYVMLGQMVCNHLTYKTGISHRLNDFSHFVQNLHLYNRHIEIAENLINNTNPLEKQPLVELNCKPKNFYKHTINDFTFANIPDRSIEKLEIAV